LPPQSAMPPAGAATAAGHVLEVSGQGEELLFVLFPHLRGLWVERVERVEDTGDAVVIRACCRAPQARCPACGAVSSRVHGGYARVVADGAAGQPAARSSPSAASSASRSVSATSWCTRDGDGPAAAASLRIEIPSARAETSACTRSCSACSSRHAARQTRASTRCSRRHASIGFNGSRSLPRRRP
jgi:hypothetical protein